MAFYPVGPNDRVVELRDLPVPDPGSAEVRLYASSFDTRLEYNVAGDAGRVSLTFDHCVLLQFGWPNDEVWHAHSLADRGLEPYGIFEVQPSGWLAAVIAANATHPGHDPKRFSTLRHLIFMLHDDAFECLAEGYRYSIGAAL